MIQIKNRWNGFIIKEIDAKSLRGSDLRGSDLRDCDLSDCDLSDCDLRDCDLRGSNLRGSDLRGSNLRGCDMRGCKNEPLIVIGLRWVVQLSGTGWMQIGCQKHSITEWSGFDDYHISEMSGCALDFWIANKTMLLALCDQWKHPEE